MNNNESEFNVRYTDMGRMVHLVESLSNGSFIVEFIVEDQETEELHTTGRQQIISQVFTSPPLEKYHADVEKATAALSKIKEERDALSQSIREDEKTYRARLDKLAVLNPTLQHLERIINLEHTHFVVIPPYGTAYIVTRSEGDEKNPNGWSQHAYTLMELQLKEYRLAWKLSKRAYVKKDAYDLEWCIPCISREEALIELQNWLDERIAEQKQNVRADYVKLADEYGLTLPADYREKVNNEKVAAHLKTVTRARKELAEAEAALKVAQGDADGKS